MAMFRRKWNSISMPENPLPLIEKYERAFLGPSSPDSVAIFEKKLGKTFFWVSFFKPAEKVDWSK